MSPRQSLCDLLEGTVARLALSDDIPTAELVDALIRLRRECEEFTPDDQARQDIDDCKNAIAMINSVLKVEEAFVRGGRNAHP